MRMVLRRIGTRTGVSLALVIVIAVAVLVAKLVDDRRSARPYPRSPGVNATVTSTEDDDSADDEEPLTYPDDEIVLAVAGDFGAAWLRAGLSAQEWLSGIRPYATDDLIGRLTGVDPSEVPARATLGEPIIASRTESHADVLVPIGPHDALALGLVATDDGWRVATLGRETG